MGFLSQEYWSRFPCPPLMDLPNPGTEQASHTLQVDSLPTQPPGKPLLVSPRGFLVVQWLSLWTPNAGGLGSIIDQGTRSHMLQLKHPTCHNEDQRSHALQLRPGTTKQISEYFLKKRDYLPTKSKHSLSKMVKEIT